MGHYTLNGGDTRERLREGAELQRVVTAARIRWPIDEYRAQELLLLTGDDHYTEGYEAPLPEEEEQMEKRTLTDQEVQQARKLGHVRAVARALSLSESWTAKALSLKADKRVPLKAEEIARLSALTPAQVAAHGKRKAAPSKKSAPVSAKASPQKEPAPTETRSLRERALELYIDGTEEDRTALRALLGVGGVR